MAVLHITIFIKKILRFGKIKINWMQQLFDMQKN